MNKLKKGFTLIELLVVIAIIGILATTLAPKLFLNLRKGTMSTVQHNLGVIRTRLSLESISNEFPDLVNGDATLLSAYTIEDTPIFTDANDVTHQPTNQVVTTRDNTGGWVYHRETGKIYANLPNGAYTKLSDFEIWTPDLADYTGSGSIALDIGDTEQINAPSDPIPPTALLPDATYSSADQSIATVSSTGLVTGITVGNTTVLQTVGGLTDNIAVTVNAPLVNESPPLASPLTASTDEDSTLTLTQVDLLSNASDPDGNNLTAQVQGNGDATAILNANGTYTITPLENFNGDTTLTYSVSDGANTTSSTINLTINPINDAPTAVDFPATGSETVVVAIDAISNDSDIDGDTISYESVVSAVMLNGVQVGNASINDTPTDFTTYASDLVPVQNNVHAGVKNDGNYVGGNLIIDGTTYTKGLVMHAETGGDSTAQYDIPADATDFDVVFGIDDYTTAGNVIISVLVDGVNVYTSGTITGSSSAISRNFDVEGHSTLTLVVDDNGGIASDHAAFGNAAFSGTHTSPEIYFTPNNSLTSLRAGEQEELTINYTIVDSNGATNDANILLNITGSNTPPTITTMNTTMLEGGTIIVANASDLDGTVSLTNGSVNGDSAGLVTIAANGDISYTASLGVTGNVLVNLSITDNNGAVTSQIIEVNIQ